MEPRTVEELRRYLDDCDRQTRSEPALGVERAKRAFSYLEKIELSPYKRRKLRMWAEGALGTALLVTGQKAEAEKVLKKATASSPPSTERAALGVRLAQFYAENLEWHNALAEADLAVNYYKAHRPRYESDIRSLCGALVARGNIAFLAFYVGSDLPLDVCPAKLAEIDYKAALESSSARTEFSALAASANLCKLALQLWWSEDEYKIHPRTIAKEMKRICRLLTRQGIRFRSRPHANARWIYGLATVESCGGLLSPSAESRLERALQDLFDLGAMSDAACLVLDLGYCYLRENRWDDILTITSTVLNHPLAVELPRPWLTALSQWRTAVEAREVRDVLSSTFKLIRGFAVTIPEHRGARIPESRYGDRSDTLGF